MREQNNTLKISRTAAPAVPKDGHAFVWKAGEEAAGLIAPPSEGGRPVASTTGSSNPTDWKKPVEPVTPHRDWGGFHDGCVPPGSPKSVTGVIVGE